MKISLVSLGAEPTARFIDHIKLAELLGFHGFFHADRKWTREAFSRLGAATQCTSKLGLGLCALDPDPRHPARLAQAAATLAEMAPGRVRIVMGAKGDAEKPTGKDAASPVAGLREAADLMRRLWRGENAALDGEAVKFADGALGWPSAVPQLYVASRAPQALKLAGGIADGVMIDALATARGIAFAKGHVLAGLQDAGRDWKDIRLCCYLHVSVLEREADPVPEAIKRAAQSAFASSREGLAEITGSVAAGVTEAVDRLALQQTMSPEMFDSFAVAGTGTQVVARLKELEAAGVQEAVICPFLTEGQDTEDVMFKLTKDVLPHFSGQAAPAF
jgi:5,10-methylenetetrahydromethanopterin reductase